MLITVLRTVDRNASSVTSTAQFVPHRITRDSLGIVLY
jgi:hypothetical protein